MILSKLGLEQIVLRADTRRSFAALAGYGVTVVGEEQVVMARN